MSAYGMFPKFKDEAGFRAWRQSWRKLYRRQVAESRQLKQAAKQAQRAAPQETATRRLQKEAKMHKIMGHKLMTLLQDAQQRRQKIRAMDAQLSAQNASFPLDFGKCPVVDFHFNRGHNDWPNLPMWVVKTKGQTFYVAHVDFRNVSFSTRELAEGSTKGMLRFRHCHLRIDADGVAHIESTQTNLEIAA